jgi:hypothetical protein
MTAAADRHSPRLRLRSASIDSSYVLGWTFWLMRKALSGS